MNEATQNDTLTGAAPVVKTETPAESGQAASEASSSTPAPERLYAGKYKTPEDLENGYKEAEPYVTKAKQLEKQVALINQIAEREGRDPSEVWSQLEGMAQQPTQTPTASSSSDSEAMRVAAAALAGNKKLEFRLEFEALAAKDQRLLSIRDLVEQQYMNTKEGSVSDIINQQFKPVLDAGANQATAKLEQKAGSNVQSAQGSGPVVEDVERNLVEAARKSKGAPKDIQALLKHREEKKLQ